LFSSSHATTAPLQTSVRLQQSARYMAFRPTYRNHEIEASQQTSLFLAIRILLAHSLFYQFSRYILLKKIIISSPTPLLCDLPSIFFNALPCPV
ncbi:MAG: hypothetical protein AABZ60_08150, partial [Planctomycetota bacterium]